MVHHPARITAPLSGDSSRAQKRQNQNEDRCTTKSPTPNKHATPHTSKHDIYILTVAQSPCLHKPRSPHHKKNTPPPGKGRNPPPPTVLDCSGQILNFLKVFKSYHQHSFLHSTHTLYVLLGTILIHFHPSGKYSPDGRSFRTIRWFRPR